MANPFEVRSLIKERKKEDEKEQIEEIEKPVEEKKEVKEKTENKTDLKFENSEDFIKRCFSRTEKIVEKEGLRYKLIEFRPQNEEVKNWVREKSFFLFEGNGNIFADKSVPREFQQKYLEEVSANWKKMYGALKENPRQVVAKIEEAINFIDGLLKSIGKESSVNYYTSALRGENGAYAARKMMENGEDMEKKTAEMIDKKRELWVASQLSPYTPYISTLFLRRDISEMQDWKNEFEEAHRNLVGKDRLEFKKMEINEEDIIKEAQNPGLGLDAWRYLQTLAYSKKAELYRPEKISHIDSYSEPVLDNIYAFSLMKHKDMAIYSGSAGFGWAVPARSKISDITDFAMVTGKEFYDEGVLKFMIIEH